MAKLLFEIWDCPDSLECSAVSESTDRLRLEGAVRRDAFYASTYDEAMAQHYQAQGWGTFKPIPGVTDVPFTDAQLAEQQAYLKTRDA